MYQSKCFQRPVGALQMGCITCHDPHVWVKPEEREVHYRAACLQCHDEAKGQHGCSAPRDQRLQTSPGDSCIDCHMPRYTHSDVVHAAATDHRILRRPPPPPPARRGRTTDLDGARFVNFYQDRFPEGDSQAERTLGLGLVKMLGAGLLRPERRGEQALASLESALGSDPEDVEAREGQAHLLLMLGRHSEALADARAALAKRPGDWRLLAWAAEAAGAEGETDAALDYWRRSVEINPLVPEHQSSLIDLLIRTGRPDEAREHCAKLMQIDPFNVAGRQAWVGLLLRQGKQAEARDEFDVIRRLRPPDLPQREEWFRQRTSEK
jgi:tetratricopeptide (TPR) repeat protein